MIRGVGFRVWSLRFKVPGTELHKRLQLGTHKLDALYSYCTVTLHEGPKLQHECIRYNEPDSSISYLNAQYLGTFVFFRSEWCFRRFAYSLQSLLMFLAEIEHQGPWKDPLDHVAPCAQYFLCSFPLSLYNLHIIHPPVSFHFPCSFPLSRPI